MTALANLLNTCDQPVVTRQDYFELLKIYAKSHRLKREDGRVVPWIDENLNPTTGDWISRTRLKSWKNGTWDAGKGGEERGKDYNHSTFCDLVISGLIGLRPRADETVEVNPLVPEGTWDYFCLDQIRYHGRWLTILFDGPASGMARARACACVPMARRSLRRRSSARVTGQLPPRRRPGDLGRLEEVRGQSGDGRQIRDVLRRFRLARRRARIACGFPGGPKDPWRWLRAATASTGASRRRELVD